MSDLTPLLPRLKTLLPGQNPGDDLLMELLGAAQALIIAYTGRKSVPEGLVPALLQLAVVQYNRLGTEGEHTRTEGGLTLGFLDLPDRLTLQLRAYRVGRAL